MKNFIAFTKKEFMEQFRSYKFLILAAVLFLFGMSSPLLAKMMPDIFSSLSMEGIKITIPTPTAMDAWSQFFKNISQMGIVVLLLVFGGILSQDVSKGTLVLPLSKGVSRNTVIISKFFSSLFTWTVCYALSAVTSIGYTSYLFKAFKEPNLFFSLFCLWLFGAFLLSVILLSSSVTKGNFGGLILSAVIIGLLMIINIAPKFTKWNPISLASQNSLLLTNAKTFDDLITAVFITVGLTIVFIVLSLVLFRKKNI